ncbi:hypothetical protein ACP275_14G273100 [Erythranthe tilingii]
MIFSFITAFAALVLCFLVAKVVSFGVSSSRADGNGAVCSVSEVAVAKEGILNKGLRVRRSKSKKKVKFVDDDDVVITRVDLYQGGENLVDDSVGGLIVEEKSRENVDQFVDKEQCFDSDARDIEESKKVEMPLEKEVAVENKDGVFSGLDSVIDQEERNEVKLGGDDSVTDIKSEGNEGLIHRDFEEETEVRDECVENEDDDWEGIERSELEKVFAEAVNYVEYGGKGENRNDDRLAKIGSDVQMELYGLHKVAVEGPCHEPQPMALKVSARAKWNAWQRLGSMNQDDAMEKYITVLSDTIPHWMHHYSPDEDMQGHHKLETVDKISVPEYERNLDTSAAAIGDSSAGGSSVEKDS